MRWRKINCVRLHSWRENEGFTQNGYHGIAANTSCSQNKIWLSNKHMAGLQYYAIKNTICNQLNHFNKLGQKAGIWKIID